MNANFDRPLLDQAIDAANNANDAAARGDDAADAHWLMIETDLTNRNNARRQAARAALHDLPQEFQAAGEDNAGASFVDMAQERGLWNKHRDPIGCCEYWELALASALDSMGDAEAHIEAEAEAPDLAGWHSCGVFPWTADSIIEASADAAMDAQADDWNARMTGQAS
jgi:hypothetical protein